MICRDRLLEQKVLQRTNSAQADTIRRQILCNFIFGNTGLKRGEGGRASQRLPLMPGVEEIVGVVTVGLGIPTLGAETIPFV